MIPEQVWESKDIPERMLFNGHPAGSGMPLVWAHAEYIKLLRSIHAEAVWDMPPQTVHRYQVDKRSADFQIWTQSQRRGYLQQGRNLRFDLHSTATVAMENEKRVGPDGDKRYRIRGALRIFAGNRDWQCQSY